MDIIDFSHAFRGNMKEPSVCHIRVVHETQRPVVVVCSELAANTGTLISKASTQLYREITEVLQHDKVLGDREKICFWIEHLPATESRNETYDLITFLPWPDGRIEISRRPGDLQAVADITGYPVSAFYPTLEDNSEGELAAK